MLLLTRRVYILHIRLLLVKQGFILLSLIFEYNVHCRILSTFIHLYRVLSEIHNTIKLHYAFLVICSGTFGKYILVLPLTNLKTG